MKIKSSLELKNYNKEYLFWAISLIYPKTSLRSALYSIPSKYKSNQEGLGLRSLYGNICIVPCSSNNYIFDNEFECREAYLRLKNETI